MIVAKHAGNHFQSVGTPRRFLMFNIIYYIVYIVKKKGRRVNFEGEKKRDIFKKIIMKNFLFLLKNGLQKTPLVLL